MPYINKIDINGVVYTLENLTDGNNMVTLPELSRDDIFVLRGNIVDNTSSTSTIQPLSARQGKLLRDDLNAEIQNRMNDVNLEEERALGAEKVLTDNLNTEIERAQAAEKVLTDNLSSEVVRAQAAEGANATAISTEKSRAEGVESGLASRIATMEAFFKEADIDASKDFIDTLKEIQSYIESDKTGAAAMASSINANQTAITTEVSRAQGVEGALQDGLDALDGDVAGLQSAIENTVRVTTQDLTANQQFCARQNIGALGNDIYEEVRFRCSDEDATAVRADLASDHDGVIVNTLVLEGTTNEAGTATVIMRGLHPGQETTDAVNKGQLDELDNRISAIVGTFVEPIDCVVEQGKSGSWTYRKWNSGVAECWGTVTGTLAPTEAESGLAGLKVFSGSVAFPTGLFVSIPSVTYNCRIGDGYAFPADAETSTTTHFNWTALSTVTTGSVECKIATKASGMWK